MVEDDDAAVVEDGEGATGLIVVESGAGATATATTVAATGSAS